MDINEAAIFLIAGGLSGWLAGLIMKGGGFGLMKNLVVGILGAFLGGWLFGLLDVTVGGKWMGPIVTSTVGAVILLKAVSMVKKA